MFNRGPSFELVKNITKKFQFSLTLLRLVDKTKMYAALEWEVQVLFFYIFFIIFHDI